MYYPNSIEEVCYERQHIDEILNEIKANFYNYFHPYIETEAGNSVDDKQIQNLAKHFGTTPPDKKKKDRGQLYKNIINQSIDDYEKDRQKYLEILNLDKLEEYKDDPSFFKNTVLKNQCPVIHATLHNKSAKELDKYRREFRGSDPNDLLSVVSNITNFAIDYCKTKHDESIYESIDDIESMQLSELLNEDYIVYGVIGGGIKSHFLYKMYPNIFPNRSRDAIWSLWYLTSKKKFKCKEDSEFLMIDVKNSVTQQNYFYPYDLFSFYALKIYLLLREEAIRENVEIPIGYRYVILDSFLSYVAQQHLDEITVLKQAIKEDSHGY